MSAVAPQFELSEPFAPRQEPAPDRRSVLFSTGKRIAASVAMLWVLSGFYIVLPDQQAVETLFGKVVAARVMPGLHFALPWPLEAVTRIKVRQLKRLVVGGTLADTLTGRTHPLVSQFLTADQNIINVRIVVQYSVGAPVDYLFQAQDPSEVVGAAVEAEVTRRVAHRTVDAVLTTEKAAIQDETRAAAQKVLNQYRAGVLLSTINIESATPPPEAATAFRDVASARADSARIANEALGYANDVIPRARGQAKQLLEEALAYQERKVNEATGDAARFDQIAVQYRSAPQVTGRRLYLETMEQVLPRIKKLIVDRSGDVDLTIIRKSDPPPPR